MDLASSSWVDVEATSAAQVLLVPVGSVEQHGPHLPLDTDTRIAGALTRRAAARLGDQVAVAPAVAYGASGEHADFSGTLSIGTGALARVLIEIGRSADAFVGVLFVNGHGGNADALVEATGVLRSEGRRVDAWSWSVPGGDAHAGRTETSLLLAVDAGAVQLERAEPGRREPVGALLDELRTAGVRPLSPNGVLGDPTGASADEGSELLERLVEHLVGEVTAFITSSPL